MKKIFFLFLSFVYFNVVNAQDKPYLIRMHYCEVEGDIEAFIKASQEFYMKLAKLAVEEGKWDGWQMWQSQNNKNQFMFFHHYSNPKQFDNWNSSDWLSEPSQKKAKVKYPDHSNYKIKFPKGYELFQITSIALSGIQSDYYVINEYSTSDPVVFIKNHELWSEMMVKPKLDQNPGMNFAAGIKLLYDGTNEVNYNGISFDGFSSLTALIENQAYFEGKWDTPNGELQEFMKASNKAGLSNFAENKKSSFWKALSSTWD